MHGTFSRIDHILGHKTSLNKFKQIEITSSIFSDHNGMKLEMHHSEKNGKRTNTWKLKNMLQKNQWVNNEIKEGIRKYLEAKDNNNHWDATKAVLRGKFVAIQAFLVKQEKSQINNLNYHLRELEKEEQTKPKVCRRKEIK